VATLRDWYEMRAVEIERLSRQADCALEMVNLAMERGVKVRTGFIGVTWNVGRRYAQAL